MTWFLSALIIGLGFYRLIVYYKKVKLYYKVPATVAGNDIKTLKDNFMGDKYFYSAVFEFTDKDGNLQSFISSEESQNQPLYKEGTKLTLLVHPDDPSRFLDGDIINGYIIPVIWIIIGIGVALAPIIYDATN